MLFVAGMSRDTGISSNWFWWAVAVGQIATVFFFARLWRRTGVVTDLEFVVKRYKASPARSFLRIFKVFFDGILINCTVIASVTLAMTKIMKTMLNISDTPLFSMPFFGEVTFTAVLLLILAGSAVLYSCLSGLRTLRVLLCCGIELSRCLAARERRAPATRCVSRNRSARRDRNLGPMYAGLSRRAASRYWSGAHG